MVHTRESNKTESNSNSKDRAIESEKVLHLNGLSLFQGKMFVKIFIYVKLSCARIWMGDLLRIRVLPNRFDGKVFEGQYVVV